ncbi:hypothetical protein TUM4438_45650 [Shewanella sairae]|uniref:Type IV secretory system conjugative DNA transfer family protein n=1 Tax=Shewanella sairae TaxID=190310 RepID=A0ABQ4PS31_9GAMM|nr:type IV secretory system conjugative DNA transfer family protein [Shewanella sairae]MCL1132646.1 type IV secretory system conjugative DNA transfer family protein [Shewanella sairae]GIU52584.1 hypothetical protein TUM4438_45650 [Shewanella sairae]
MEKAKKIFISVPSDTVTITFPQEYNSWDDILSTGNDDKELEHIVCIGRCRTGKTTSLVIPTLLNWQHSAIISDFTSELWPTTAGYRATLGDVLRFAPLGQCSARWNPFEELRMGTDNEAKDIDMLCSCIMPKLDDHNEKVIFKVFAELVTYFIEQCKQRQETPTFPRLANLNLTELLYELYADSVHGSQAPENIEQDTIIQAISNALAPYSHPSLAITMSHSDFSVKKLNQRDKPISLYMMARPWEMPVLGPIFKLLIAMTTHMLTDKELSSHAKFTLLGMMDEYPTLRGMGSWQKNLPLMLESKIKFCFITQDINQINKHCAEDEMLTRHCHMQIAFTPISLSTANHMLNHGDHSLSMRDCMNMSPSTNTNHGEMLIYTRGKSLIRAQQFFYFDDDELLTRSEIQAPS